MVLRGTGDAEGLIRNLWEAFPGVGLPVLGQGQVVVVKKLEVGPTVRLNEIRTVTLGCILSLLLLLLQLVLTE